MRVKIPKEQLTVELVLISILLMILQSVKFSMGLKEVFLLDLVFSFLIGLFLLSLTEFLFGTFKRKAILHFFQGTCVVILIVLGLFDVLFTFFIIVAVLMTLISLSENFIKDIITKKGKRR